MGRYPPWAKGKQILCDICAAWYGEYSGKITKQRGLNVCYRCRDKLTDEEREKSIRRS